MEAKTKQKKLNNELWRARHRAGLEQKQVAHLLGHKSCDQISRYERGARTPGFKTLLKLELIYHQPLRGLFPDHYTMFQAEVALKAEHLKASLGGLTGEAMNADENGNFCTFLVPLAKPQPSESEIGTVRRHAILIHRLLSEALQRNQPSPE